MLEAQKKSMAAVEGGPGFYTPDIDNRLAVLYTRNRRIDEWRSGESGVASNSDSSGATDAQNFREADEKAADGNGGAEDEPAKKRSKLVDFAKTQVGENGIGDIGAVYQDWAGLGYNQDWCVALVRYCADKAGITLENTNSSTGLSEWYGKNSKLYTLSTDPNSENYPKAGTDCYPKVGDIVFINNNVVEETDPEEIKKKYAEKGIKVGELTGTIDHVAIVVAVDGNKITTIEGNLSSDGVASTSLVKRKTYINMNCDSYTARIIAFGRN